MLPPQRRCILYKYYYISYASFDLYPHEFPIYNRRRLVITFLFFSDFNSSSSLAYARMYTTIALGISLDIIDGAISRFKTDVHENHDLKSSTFSQKCLAFRSYRFGGVSCTKSEKETRNRISEYKRRS